MDLSMALIDVRIMTLTKRKSSNHTESRFRADCSVYNIIIK